MNKGIGRNSHSRGRSHSHIAIARVMATVIVIVIAFILTRREYIGWQFDSKVEVFEYRG